MTWNWQLKEWPHFKWSIDNINCYEQEFITNLGLMRGAIKHLTSSEQQELTIEIIGLESLSTSEIEGELLQRESVRSSIMRAFGLKSSVKASLAEQSIANLMSDLYLNIKKPLTEERLFNWHHTLMQHDRYVESLGCYRTFNETMEIISGPDYAKKIHFQAPPSLYVPAEMKALIEWYQQQEKGALSNMLVAGIIHLWFESIHPFEDGNGRIGRAIAEHALNRGLTETLPILLSQTILKNRNQYYQQLALVNKTLEITSWLEWFIHIVIEAQNKTINLITFIIQKSKLMNKLKDSLNKRQEKVLLRLFREGPEGFTGGLCAANYRAITGATIATTTRDLNALVKMCALTKTGERKSTRYHLNLTDN